MITPALKYIAEVPVLKSANTEKAFSSSARILSILYAKRGSSTRHFMVRMPFSTCESNCTRLSAIVSAMYYFFAMKLLVNIYIASKAAITT